MTDIEFDLLQQLCTDERLISVHQSRREMYRLVEAGYVKATFMNPDAVLYTILPLAGAAAWFGLTSRDLLHRLWRVDRKTIERPVDREGGRLSDFTLGAIDQRHVDMFEVFHRRIMNDRGGPCHVRGLYLSI